MNNRYFLAIIIGIALTITIPIMLSQQSQSSISVTGTYELSSSSTISLSKVKESSPKMIDQSINIPLKQKLFIDGYDHEILYFYFSAETKKTAVADTGVPNVIRVDLQVSVDAGNTWKTIGSVSGLTTAGVLHRDGTGGFTSPVDTKTEAQQIMYRITAVGNGEVTNVQVFVIPLLVTTWL